MDQPWHRRTNTLYCGNEQDFSREYADVGASTIDEICIGGAGRDFCGRLCAARFRAGGQSRDQQQRADPAERSAGLAEPHSAAAIPAAATAVPRPGPRNRPAATAGRAAGQAGLPDADHRQHGREHLPLTGGLLLFSRLTW